MKDLIAKFERVFITADAKDSSLANRVREVFPSHQITVVADANSTAIGARGELSAREFEKSKRQLLITPFKGSFFKRCPGSRPGLLCCNYFVLNFGAQCDMNCSYCYLQSFINAPALTLYSNLDRAFEELEAMGPELARQKVRIGTGETVDSLSLDRLTLFSHRLIAFFRERPNWTLEFKTKSADVDQFLDVEHAGNVLVSWSINPQFIISSEEHGTASLSERLNAAEKCLAKGFSVAFHIDPMIWHPEWKKNYDTLIDELLVRFRPDQIPYLSLGALRFQPEQRHLMRERFGMDSWVTRAEVFTGSDGKLRYDQSIRQEMFEHVLNRFKQADPQWRIFLCMETPETWSTAAHMNPFKSEPMHDLFTKIRINLPI